MSTDARHAQERRDAEDPWLGPFAEFDKYGEPTGAQYVRCRDCGVEAVTSIATDSVDHRANCRFVEVQ